MMLTDAYGRTVKQLRLSVTDRCNMACTYCVPEGGFKPMAAERLLSSAELIRLSRLFLAMGVRKIRLTGGEPLLRPGLLDLVAGLRGLGEFELALSTNGLLLEKMAGALERNGLDKINVSLDSFDEGRFKVVTGGSRLAPVLRGLQAALGTGMQVKVNAVSLASLNDWELEQFAALALAHPVEVRFIEYMPLHGETYDPSQFISNQVLLGRFRKFLNLIPVIRPGEKAQVYEVEGGPGKLGFISSLSRNFCGTCDRARLSADGRIRPCLFSPVSFDLKALMREGAADEDLSSAIRIAIFGKPEGHQITPGTLKRYVPVDAALIRSIGG